MLHKGGYTHGHVRGEGGRGGRWKGGGGVISFPPVFFPESQQGGRGRSAAPLARKGESAPRNRSRDRYLHLP